MSTTSRFGQLYSTFVPLHITGCTLWLDAADPTVLNLDGVIVNNWYDKSISNNTAFGSSGSYPTYTETQNGKKVVSFNGSSQYLSLAGPELLPTGTTDFSVFIAAKSVLSASTVQYLFRFGGTTTGTAFQVQTVKSGSNITLNQDYYGTTGSSDTTNVNNTFFIFSNLSTTSTTSPYRNGSIFTTIQNYSYNLGTTNGYIGTFNASQFFFYGTIGEIVVYNRQLNTTERRQVEGYLANKWGTQASLVSGHPYISRAPFASQTFRPADIDNCMLWLDGADHSTNSMTLSGSTITTWKDKTGNSSNATAYGSPTIGYFIKNRKSVSLGTTGGGYFLGTTSNTTTTLTCFAVASTTATLPIITKDQRLVSLVAGTNVDYGYESGVIALFNQLNTSWIGTWRVALAVVADNPIEKEKPFMACSQYDGTKGYMWFNGSAGQLPSSASSGNFAITNYGIGLQANGTAGEYWNGYVGEVIVFNAYLSSSIRQLVEGYLAWKWGLQDSLPDDHLYKKFPPMKPS